MMPRRKMGPGAAHQILERYAARLERSGEKASVVLAIHTMLDHRLDLLERLHPERPPFPESARCLKREAAA